MSIYDEDYILVFMDDGLSHNLKAIEFERVLALKDGACNTMKEFMGIFGQSIHFIPSCISSVSYWDSESTAKYKIEAKRKEQEEDFEYDG